MFIKIVSLAVDLITEKYIPLNLKTIDIFLKRANKHLLVDLLLYFILLLNTVVEICRYDPKLLH